MTNEIVEKIEVRTQRTFEYRKGNTSLCFSLFANPNDIKQFMEFLDLAVNDVKAFQDSVLSGVNY